MVGIVAYHIHQYPFLQCNLRVLHCEGLPSFSSCISDEEEDEELDTFRLQRSPDLHHFATASEVRDRARGAERLQEEGAATAARALKTIHWKEGGQPEPKELERLFPRKELAAVERAPARSLLTRLLEEQPGELANPWLEFARFHGVGCADPKLVKTVAIFCPMTQVYFIL